MVERSDQRNGGQEGVRKTPRAVQYVRMSTEHQKYSTENQAEAIRQYAAARTIDIVKTYADEGKSGLSIDGRDALKQLIDDVDAGRADFEMILVYDVSRWGRFQDADESAYYEYICKRSGISVQYCAEQFENDGSPVSTIVKGVKRAMAGEYSRDLSVKVFAGQCRLIELGFRQGGPPGFGLRRALIDQSGTPKGELNRGEQKSIQTDRVVLTSGPDGEIAVVRTIYRRFVEDLASERQIAEELNKRGSTREAGRPWTRGTVHQVLINEKYIGNNVWNRVSFKLKKKRIRNRPEMWIRAEGVFPAIIDRHVFEAAQTIIRARSFRMSDQEMLDALKDLRGSLGLLSGLIIDEAEGLPSSSAYRSRFGSLLRAYHLVGYTPRRDYRYVEINRGLRALHPGVVSEILGRLRDIGCHLSTDAGTDRISVNGELAISVVIARCHRTSAGSFRWRLRFDTGLQPDITIAVRMDASNERPLDYYLFPGIDIATEKLKLAEDNGLAIDGYRFDSLDPLYELLEPVIVTEAA
ncbi:recombinase family protein [Xanthobacter sp. 91]|uniref:recombinase family protein n=1 Tax=Xanthobacter sp. 91 TaxID=1117244 RepID=UPI002477D8A4|nr:recombinase family protein [Xanthobacter sp. 91]